MTPDDRIAAYQAELEAHRAYVVQLEQAVRDLTERVAFLEGAVIRGLERENAKMRAKTDALESALLAAHPQQEPN